VKIYLEVPRRIQKAKAKPHMFHTITI